MREGVLRGGVVPRPRPVETRLSLSEFAALQAAALARDLTMSALIRAALREVGALPPLPGGGASARP